MKKKMKATKQKREREKQEQKQKLYVTDMKPNSDRGRPATRKPWLVLLENAITRAPVVPFRLTVAKTHRIQTAFD